jgi:asparagine synthase (glutamine-hydrolysing)
MCGVFAVFSTQRDLRFNPETYIDCARRLKHRGPDAFNYFYDSKSFFSTHRLQIVGNEENRQPQKSKDGRFDIAFNGEIYNFRLIREELRQLGDVFSTDGDTEVILKAFIKWGDSCFARFEGQFAIVIFDRKLEQFWVARDRFGEKPLYYYANCGEIYVSSEISPISALPVFVKELHKPAILDLMMMWYIQQPETIFVGVRSVEPGSYMIFSKEGNKTKYYSDWDATNKGRFEGSSLFGLGDYLLKLDYLICQSLDLQLTQNVNSALSLSSGVDSSILAAYISKLGYKIPVVTSKLTGPSNFDESLFALETASKLGLECHVIEVDSPTTEEVESIVSKLDEPIGEPSLFPAFELSEFVRSKLNAKVMYSGDGADELFGGYPTYFATKLNSFTPEFITKIARANSYLLNLVPNGAISISNKDLLSRFLYLGQDHLLQTHFAWRFNLSSSLLYKKLFEVGIEYNPFRNVPYILDEKVTLEDCLQLDRKSWLLNSHLRKMDRASMLNSVENRSPFLSKQLLDFSVSIPPRFKIRGFQTKILPRLLAKELGLNGISKRRKRGWTPPLENWLKKLSPHVDYMMKDGFIESEILHQPWHTFLEEAKSLSFVDANRLLWSCYVAEVWIKHNV